MDNKTKTPRKGRLCGTYVVYDKCKIALHSQTQYSILAKKMQALYSTWAGVGWLLFDFGQREESPNTANPIYRVGMVAGNTRV